MRLSLFLLLLMFTIALSAQQNPGGKGARTGDGPATGIVKGIIIDSLTQEPLAYATVALHNVRNDSLVGGGISNDKGKVFIDQLRPGKYLARVKYLGYETRVINNIFIRPRADEQLDIGLILLSGDLNQLEAVQVNAERSYMQVGIDRKVYTISKDLGTAGGDAIEAMRNIPSVEVDVDGNIALRGSGNVNVLIDGKPSILTGLDLAGYLESLPASSVESIEVITNPSARFDPDGTAGLINIVLKKNRKKGISGGLTAGLGTREKYNGSANLNFRNRHINFFANYGYRNMNTFGRRSIYRETTVPATGSSDSLITLDQNNESDNNSNSHNAKIGLDWYVDNKTTISASAVYSTRFRGGGGVTEYRNLDPLGVLNGLTFQDEFDHNESSSWDANLRFEKQFTSREHSFFFDSRFSTGEKYDREFNLGRDALLDGSPGSASDFLRVLRELEDRQTITLESGYTHPHMIQVNGKPVEKWRIETGLKAILNSQETDFTSAISDTVTGMVVDEVGTSNIFSLTENILSAYGTYRQRWGVWGAQLGLRAEAALTNPQLLTTGETFDNDYFSLFPTVHLSRQLEKRQEFQVSYSRRVNRPRHWALNPFVDRSDPLNIRIGNPDLQPEFVHKVEAGYVKSWESGNVLTSSIYFTHTDDLITSFRTVDELGVTTTNYENFSWKRRIGVELIGSFIPTDWWRATLSGNLYRASVDASNIELGLTNTNIGWTVKGSTSFTIPWDVMLQLNGRYQGPRVGPQGTFKGYFTLDASVRKNLWDSRASLTLRVSDMFDQRRFGMLTDIPGLFQDAEYKRESRIGWLTFSYKFGKQQFDRKKSGRPAGGGFDDDGDLGG